MPPTPPTIVDARFLVEARSPASVPAAGPPEVAIAGRSNVGKSTLLNRLSGRRALARTSKTPGRTRGIMFYELDARWPGQGGAGGSTLRLVDLPGYGYAQVSQAERKGWQPLIEGFVEKRSTLKLFLILIDARREIEDEERQLIEWLDTLGVPHRVVVTKVDKLSAGERGMAGAKLKRAAVPGGAPLLVSGQTGEGVDRLWATIDRALRGDAAAAPPQEPPQTPG